MWKVVMNFTVDVPSQSVYHLKVYGREFRAQAVAGATSTARTEFALRRFSVRCNDLTTHTRARTHTHTCRIRELRGN
jgi:hypothetical protein